MPSGHGDNPLLDTEDVSDGDIVLREVYQGPVVRVAHHGLVDVQLKVSVVIFDSHGLYH